MVLAVDLPRRVLGAGAVAAALGLSVVAHSLWDHAPADQAVTATSAVASVTSADEVADVTSIRSMAALAVMSASRRVPSAQASATLHRAATPARTRQARTRSTATYPVLTWGSTGPFVTRVQRILGLPQTGVFGSRTHAAVLRFQVVHHIAPTDGVVRATTWAVLRRVTPATHVATVTRTLAVTVDAPRATPPTDPTMTAAMRDSYAARAALGLARWQSSAHGRMIAQRESSGRCDAVSPGGTYRGKWQMSASFWKANGGTAFAASADQASCAQQDLVAYRGWITSWWFPWGG